MILQRYSYILSRFSRATEKSLPKCDATDATHSSNGLVVPSPLITLTDVYFKIYALRRSSHELIFKIAQTSYLKGKMGLLCISIHASCDDLLFCTSLSIISSILLQFPDLTTRRVTKFPLGFIF